MKTTEMNTFDKITNNKNVRAVLILILAIVVILISHSCDTSTAYVSNSYLLEEINITRIENGCNVLEWSNELECAAQQQSAWMKDKETFAHTNLTMNLANCGFYGSAGENIAYGQDSIETVLQAWLDSEGHRKNLLNPTYNCVGCSQVGIYWTLIIGRK